jgi:hypothetical protein
MQYLFFALIFNDFTYVYKLLFEYFFTKTPMSIYYTRTYYRFNGSIEGDFFSTYFRYLPFITQIS